MVLHHATRRSAGAAGVDDAGEVLASNQLRSLLERLQVGVRGHELVPMMEVDRARRLPGAEFLDADDVIAFGAEEDGGNKVLRQLLRRDDNCLRARIAEDVRVIAR